MSRKVLAMHSWLRAPEEMYWTDRKPTEPGKYWVIWERTPTGETFGPDLVTLDSNGEVYTFAYELEADQSLIQLWCGPLVEPKFPEEV